MDDWKQYLPLGLIGAVILYAVYKLSSSGRTQIINRAVTFPQTGPQADTRDPYRAQGFGQLVSAAVATGQQKNALESAKLNAQTALTLAQTSAANQLALQQDRGANILNQIDLLGRYKAFDVQQQLNAQAATQQRAAALQNRNALFNGIAALLNSLRPSSSSSRPAPSSGGGFGTPPFNPGGGATRSNPVRGGYDYGALSSFYNDWRSAWDRSPVAYNTDSIDWGLDFGAFRDYNYGDYGMPGFGYDYNGGSGELTGFYPEE